MGNTQQQQAYQQVNAESSRVLGSAYGLAIPAEKARQGYLNEALSTGGEPDYMKSAFGEQRTGLIEGGIDQQRLATQQGRTASEGAALGGNLQAGTTAGMQLGSKMADALYGSRMNEALGGLDQTNKLYTSMIGQSVQTGDAAYGAAGSQLANIGNMANYNKTYANVVGALNVGGSIYGAGSQAGWFNSTPGMGSQSTGGTGVNPVTGGGGGF